MFGRRTRAISKNADYLVDINLLVAGNRGGDEWSNSRRRRFRDVSIRKYDVDGDRVDKDYVAFMLDLEEFVEAGDLDEDEDEDKDDPLYEMFLENLEARGNSYVLHTSIEHGVYAPIMYEMEDVRSMKVEKRQSPRFGFDEYAPKEREFVGKNNRRNVRFWEVNGMRNMRTRGGSMKRKKSFSRVDDYVEEEMTWDSRKDNMSDYEIPKSLKRWAKAVDEDIQEKRTVYEVVKPRKLKSHTKSDIQEKRSLNVDDFPNFGAENPASKKMKTKPVCFDYSQEEPLSAPKTPSLEKKAINEVYKLFLDNFKANGDTCVYEYGDRKLVYYDLPNDTSPTTKADSSKQAFTVVAASSDHLPSDWPITIAADSSMQPINVAPISSVQVRREIVFGLSSNMSLRWKKDRYLPSTVHIPSQCRPSHPSTSIVPVLTQCRPTQPSTSIVPAPQLAMVPLDKQNLQVCHRVPSNMRKKLLVILNQPYNKEEHEQLWKEVNMRSAVQIHRDSRSGGSDRPGQMGRSLLDWNPDLASEIEKVKYNPPRVLNLLRMLSFYIRKIPCGRICKPWLDDTLTTIVPGSS